MQKLRLTAAAVAVYLAAFFLISFLSDIDPEALIFLPVFAAGWSWGIRAGALAGLIGIPLNMILMVAAGRPDWNIFAHQHSLAGAIGSIIIGATAGYLGSLREQTRRASAVQGRMGDVLQLLRAAVGSLPIGITIVDTEGKIVYLNLAEAEMHGRRVEELLGEDSRVLAPQDAWKPIPFEELYAMGVWKRESVNVRANGERFPVQLTSIAVTNAEGAPIGVITACEDVTDRKRAEEALRASEASYRTLSENLPGIVYRVHLEDRNRMQIFNHMLEPMTGYTAEELLSGAVCSLDPLILPEDRETVTGTIRRAVLAGELFEIEYRLRHKNGEVRHFLERGRPVAGPEEKPSHIDGVIFDVTERKKMEERLENARKLEVIGKLAGGVAHEVRNPLNAIMALSDALAKDLGNDPAYEPYLAHIRAQVDRLSALMQDLLDLGKPVGHYQMQLTFLAEACAMSVDSWRQFGNKRAQPVEIVLPPHDPVPVMADAKKLHQVFVNLLDNAAQHSPEGGMIRIIVEAPEDGICRIRVVDRGSGIPAGILGRVFEPFFTTRRGGTGLGMSIVKHIVEAHGGTVAVANNDPPPGCTAEIRLPLAGKAVP